MENPSPQDELRTIDDQIKAATDLAALRPLFTRLHAILQAYPGDFDIQLTGNEIKQRLLARGAILKEQQESAIPSAPLSPPRAAPPLPPPPPAVRRAPPVQPVAPARPAPPPAPRPAAGNWNRTSRIGAIGGLLLAMVCVILLVREVRQRSFASVQVNVITTPAGAVIDIIPDPAQPGAAKAANCESNCKVALTPGTYRVSAVLDGYEPAIAPLTVAARKPASVNLTLQAQAPVLRVLTNLAQGKVVLDDRSPVDLQDGQAALDQLAPGTHTVKLNGANEEASFSFEIANARPPAVTGPVSVRNVIAILVSNFGTQARLVTNSGPWKLTLNGRPQNDAAPAGTDLAGFQKGVNEIVVGEGKDQHSVSESFTGAPTLTAFLKSDVNTGTLIVSTGQDDVHVFLNDKEYRRTTRHGELRIETLGKVAVRVAKSGFLDVAAQTAEVKKGDEVRLQFDLKPQPQFGALQIHDAMAGTEVMLDQKDVGTVESDGSFSVGRIEPGEHTIELRRDQYQPKRLDRTFHAGQAVVLGAADAVLAPVRVTLRFTRSPESAAVTYQCGADAEAHDLRGSQIDLPPGNCVISASAPGYTGATTHLQLVAGQNQNLTVTLVPERPAAPAPPPIAENEMTDFEDAQSWRKEGDSWVHKGGGFALYKLPPKGTFTFTVQLLKGGGVFRAGAIRWCLQYVDSRNYLLYELDRKNFWAGVVEKGKRYERAKVPSNLGTQKAITIQVDVNPESALQRVRVGDEWKVLDTFTEAGRDFTQGKFGFLIQGNDEIAISAFKFQPK